MTISVQIIEDSISPAGVRLTTFQLRYPRLIHSEFMTHRVFSRNASSSRAIPIKRQIRDIITDPAEPVEWGSAQKGMQAGKPLYGWRLATTRFAWHTAKWAAIGAARLALFAGAHKQIANRILEPWSHISVVVSSTDWVNFFALRCHPDADPTIRELANQIRKRYRESVPTRLQPGMWHLPYIGPFDRALTDNETLIKMSAARCARVSYLLHDGQQATSEQDLELYEKLVGSIPKHASPTEHQATPDRGNAHLHGNFRGWIQHRKTIPDEAFFE